MEKQAAPHRVQALAMRSALPFPHGQEQHPVQQQPTQEQLATYGGSVIHPSRGVLLFLFLVCLSVTLTMKDTEDEIQVSLHLPQTLAHLRSLLSEHVAQGKLSQAKGADSNFPHQECSLQKIPGEP